MDVASAWTMAKYFSLGKIAFVGEARTVICHTSVVCKM